MSDSLREALGELADTYAEVHGGKPGAPGSRERIYFGVEIDLRSALAAHPVEPAPAVSESALAAAERAYETFGNGMQEALEAALPHLAPRPLLDREAVVALLRRVVLQASTGGQINLSEVDTTPLADAVMELARPMPTREQIEQALVECGIGSYRTIVATAVLALLNGAES